MDYSSAINTIIADTNNKSIVWCNENPQSHQDIIFNYNFAYKAYGCNYIRNGQEVKLLFVEKKFPDQHSDFADVVETYFPELIIRHGNAVIGVLDENNSNKDDLIRLAGAIESNNEGMNNFLKMFN
jgi:hypothetical protein